MSTAPDLTGWLAYCESCDADRAVERREEKDASTGETYYDYICAVCDSILLCCRQAGGRGEEG